MKLPGIEQTRDGGYHAWETASDSRRLVVGGSFRHPPSAFLLQRSAP